MMRVISGKYKGKNLKGFNIDGTRPTMDRVKESLFAMIQNNISGSAVLDLFAGSGSLGIEAISNGAKEAYFVDNNIELINIIKNNTKDIKDEVHIIKSDYLSALNLFKNSKIKFDIIFLDPPYDTDFAELACKRIIELDLLNNNGIIIIETDKKENVVQNINKLNLIKIFDERKYGRVNLIFLKK